MINYEQEVKKVYLGAVCSGCYNRIIGTCLFEYRVYADDRYFSKWQLSKQSAWQSAYEKLKKEGKI